MRSSGERGWEWPRGWDGDRGADDAGWGNFGFFFRGSGRILLGDGVVSWVLMLVFTKRIVYTQAVMDVAG